MSTALDAYGDVAAPNISSVTDQVVEHLRSMIFSGDLQPGQRMTIQELADTLGVSRTPVRDALHRLDTEGLVTIRPRAGVRVRPIDEDEARDTYRLRLAVEPLAVELAMHRTDPHERQSIADLARRLGPLAETTDTAAFERTLEGLHRGIFVLSRSQVLLDTYDVTGPRLRLLRVRNLTRPGRLEASVRQHLDIANTFASDDIEAARSAMVRHLEDAARHAEQALDTER